MLRLSPRVVVLCLLVIVFVGFSFGPTMKNLEANSELKRREAELAGEQRATRALQEQARKAHSMEYIEKEARKQRLVAPGEVLYLVTGEDADGKIEYRVKEIQSMEEAWRRVQLVLTGGGTRGEEP